LAFLLTPLHAHAESLMQKLLKTMISSRCEDRPASLLVVSLGKAFIWMPLRCVVTLVVTGGSLTRRPKRSLRCLLFEN